MKLFFWIIGFASLLVIGSGLAKSFATIGVISTIQWLYGKENRDESKIVIPE